MSICRSVVLIAAALVAACSSTPTSSTGTNGPASLAIVAGDGQTAAAGSTLPVPLAVVVKDASGAVVAGATVHFAVDSGGGSLASGSAVTSSAGIASAGLWTLGPAAGATNVVSVTVGSLTPMRFHAQALGATATTLFNASPVGTGGGTLTYTRAGDPLNGLTVTVPASSYPTSVVWTIVADSTIKAPLPSDVFQVGPALVVTNGQGYSDSVITLTVPMSIDTSDALVPFYYDVATQTLEPIPLVARTATSATLGTRHFSGDLMAVRGNASLRSGASLRAPFGSVVIVWARASSASLAGTWNSGFAPGIDDWEFVNYGDYISPDGDCEGMSVTEMYYYYFVGGRNGPPLYHEFDTSLINPYDNVQGIRLVGSVQADFSNGLQHAMSQLYALRQQAAAHRADLGGLTSSWIALTLKATHQPVLLSLRGTDVGHAVVAYAATVDPQTGVVVSFADPNFPATQRTMSFVQGVLAAPVSLQINAHAVAAQFTEVDAVGVTGDVPLTTLQSRWAEFKAGDAGADRIPDHTMEIFDSLNQVWNPLNDGDTIRTTIDVLNLRVRCAGCTVPIPGADPSDAQIMYIFGDSGATKLGGDNPVVVLPPGSGQYVGLAMAASPYSQPVGALGILDSRTFQLIYGPFYITPHTLTGTAGLEYDFTASNGGVANSASRFVWDFGDGSDSVVVTGDSTVTHAFVSTGALTVTVKLRDAQGTLLGRYAITVSISNYIAWQLTAVTSATIAIPPGGLVTEDDSSVANVDQQSLAEIQGAPSRAYIFVEDSADCRGVFLGAADPANVAGYSPDPKQSRAVLAVNCTSNPALYQGSVHLDSLGHGTLAGTVGDHVLGYHVGWVHAPDVDIGAGSITATMNGPVLTGTLVWSDDYGGGVGTYTIQFTATQVQPAPGAGLRARVMPSRSP